MPTLLALGIAVALALLGGRLAARFHIPRVTVYLFVGILAGPSAAKLFGLPPLLDSTAALEPLLDFILALILFSIGGHFRFPRFRRSMGRFLIVSAAETILTFGLVFAGVVAVGQSAAVGALLGVIAVATAPAATVFVIREFESEGPVTDLTMVLTGLNNLISVLGFVLICYFVLPAEASQPALYRSLGIPLGLGAGIGFLVAIWDTRLERAIDRQLLGISAVTAVAGFAQLFDVNALLACLVAGAVVVNSSTRERRLFEALREIDYPLYVLFFVLAGARLHLDAIPHMGVVGVAYVVARAVGKIAGAGLGAYFTGVGGKGRHWLGVALMAQAGVAIGLARTLRNEWPGVGAHLETVVLAAVVFFEALGPPLVRTALVRAGEVTWMTLLFKKASVGVIQGVEQVVEHFRKAVGIPTWRKIESPADIPISQLMRRNVETVSEAASFNEVLRHLSGSRYDRLLVIDEEKRLAGVINFADIRPLVAEAMLTKLLRAVDMTTKNPATLKVDATVADAIALFETHGEMAFIPVVSSDDPRELCGIVSQNDILGTFRRLS